MKTVLDKSTREELISRINTLHENSKAEWGKMNVAQMLKHCRQWDEMAMGDVKYKQSFIGRLFGKVALKNMLKDQPMKRNLPTVPSFVIKDNPDLAAEKIRWIELLRQYENFSGEGFVHPFFGKLTRENVGYIVYKHADHHLKQFGA